jgi:DNA invertase Pin-like site-specific DNA recombinase
MARSKCLRKATALRAAQYIRMSTDHQKYSPINQADAINDYASGRGIKIVRTYADEGRSGLTFDYRPALKRLIKDVESGNVDFSVVLVYDVSRWGRFQDIDESAYYEFICKRAGISIEYCAEEFENDGSPLSAIVKGIKRAMAAEYSRELSIKSFNGKARIVTLGYRAGGSAGYGLRRLLVDQSGVPKGELGPGQWKSVNTDRVILVPGPREEIATIRWMFSTFVHNRQTEFQIAQKLNRRKISNAHGRRWNRHTIKDILQNEKYIGNNVWNRTSFKLHNRFVFNSSDKWLRADSAFQPIVDKPLFDAAQAIYRDREVHPIGGRPRLYSDEEMIKRLRWLLRKFGYLSKTLMDKTRGIQCGSAYENRFGSLTEVYELIGYRPRNRKRRRIRARRTMSLSDKEMLGRLRRLLRQRGNLSQKIVSETKYVPSRTAYISRFGSMQRAYELIGFRPDPHRSLSPRPHGLTERQLLDALSKAVREQGYVSQAMIYKDKTMPSYFAYQVRFGGFERAYRLIGFTPKYARK